MGFPEARLRLTFSNGKKKKNPGHNLSPFAKRMNRKKKTWFGDIYLQGFEFKNWN